MPVFRGWCTIIIGKVLFGQIGVFRKWVVAIFLGGGGLVVVVVVVVIVTA